MACNHLNYCATASVINICTAELCYWFSTGPQSAKKRAGKFCRGSRHKDLVSYWEDTVSLTAENDLIGLLWSHLNNLPWPCGVCIYSIPILGYLVPLTCDVYCFWHGFCWRYWLQEMIIQFKWTGLLRNPGHQTYHWDSFSTTQLSFSLYWYHSDSIRITLPPIYILRHKVYILLLQQTLWKNSFSVLRVSVKVSELNLNWTQVGHLSITELITMARGGSGTKTAWGVEVWLPQVRSWCHYWWMGE